MSSAWFIGDLHFGHNKVSEIRGFPSVGKHDLYIATVWNACISPDDVVYVLGDLSNGKPMDEAIALDILRELPGKKRLICGNHDSVSGIHRRSSPNIDLFRDTFESISDYGRIRMEKKDIYLSHYPYRSQGDGPNRGSARYEQFRLPDIGNLLIHAHTHHNHPTNGSKTGRELCVSWDAWKRPVGMSDIHRWVLSSMETK